MSGRARRAAAFLDRDGTIIDDVHYLARPEDVRLLPGAAAAVRRLADAGMAIVVVTNQSGIARGLLSEDDYARVHARMVELLAAEGAYVDGAYHCPHHPELSGPCECRKPGTLLHRRAIDDLGLDPSISTCVGDRLRDVLPAVEIGGLGVLVPSMDTPASDRDDRPPATLLAHTLGEAAAHAIAFAASSSGATSTAARADA